MDPIAAAAAVAALLLLCCFFFSRWGSLWVQARLHGVRAGLFRVFCMRSPRRLVHAAILAKKGGIDADVSRIEDHLRKGGDPQIVVLGLIAADEAGVRASFEELAALDLAGGDVLAHVRSRAADQSGQPT